MTDKTGIVVLLAVIWVVVANLEIIITAIIWLWATYIGVVFIIMVILLLVALFK